MAASAGRCKATRETADASRPLQVRLACFGRPEACHSEGNVSRRTKANRTSGPPCTATKRNSFKASPRDSAVSICSCALMNWTAALWLWRKGTVTYGRLFGVVPVTNVLIWLLVGGVLLHAGAVHHDRLGADAAAKRQRRRELGVGARHADGRLAGRAHGAVPLPAILRPSDRRLERLQSLAAGDGFVHDRSQFRRHRRQAGQCADRRTRLSAQLFHLAGHL